NLYMDIKTYIQKHKISIENFADTISTSPVAVYKYINGERIPSAEKMKLIFHATGGKVTANDFYNLSLSDKQLRAAKYQRNKEK
ncbi:MAG: helix-turn-helix transcriptional regulator, partial [Pseudomonadota bacterium]